MAGKANPLGKKLCATFAIAGMPIMLHQEAKNRFTVTYWKQVTDGLTYSQAATKLGSCIMHALACEGRLDNRARGEGNHCNCQGPPDDTTLCIYCQTRTQINQDDLY